MKSSKAELELCSKEDLGSIIIFLYQLESMHIEALAGGQTILGLSEESLVKKIFDIAHDIVIAKDLYRECI